MDMSSNSDWASLSVDVLSLILDYLAPMEDYLAFSEVCVQWQHAVREKLKDLRSNHKRHCRQHQQVPLLLLAPTPYRDKYCLYDFIEGKIVREFELRRLEPGKWRFEGSSHGWLIVFGLNSYKVLLFNPFSGDTILLPPLKESVLRAMLSDGEVLFYVPSTRRRCVLSMDPNGNESVVMITCKTLKQKIAFIKVGEEHWTYVKELRDLEDIACINGYFYLTDTKGVPYSVHVNYNNIDDLFYKLRRIISPDDGDGHGHGCEQYLVESPEGDLLRVVTIKKVCFIYKLTWFSRNPRWEEVMDLGDVALFLGSNNSTSVTASDFPGCMRNCVYVCIGSNVFYPDGSVLIFNLTDKTLKRLPSHPPQPQLWVSSNVV